VTTPAQQQEFMGLLQAHRGILYKVAGGYSRTAADRDDLIQEICMQLWRAFPRYDRQRPFPTWMYRVALNVAISRVRRTPGTHLEPLRDIHLETLGTDGENEERQARLAAMYALIGALAPLDRALILLYLDDRSQAEMADILGISETNVATKINRIKHKLRGQAAAYAGA
jgi:RNA polymerase sigma-70 factor (ECF subfamily)